MPHKQRISQIIAAKIGATAQLMNFVQTHSETLCHSLSDLLELPSNQENAPIVIQNLLMAKIELLEESTRQMRDAEMAYLEEQDDDITLRGRLAEASIELDRKLRMTRDHIRQSEGPNALQIYGLQDAPPRARQALVSYTHNVIELLRSHPYTFTGPLGQTMETRTVAVTLNDLLEPFARIVSDMDNEITELKSALARRNDAIDDWVHTYHGILLHLQGVSLIIDRHDLREELVVLTTKLNEHTRL